MSGLAESGPQLICFHNNSTYPSSLCHLNHVSSKKSRSLKIWGGCLLLLKNGELMPTVLAHAAPALTLGMALGAKIIPPRLLVAGVALSLAPDLDSIGFYMGMPYESLLGHRGLSHSLAAAALAGAAGLFLAPWFKSGRIISAGFLFLAVAGHIILDAATSGGLGPACFWPFDEGRHFLPWRPIRVAPMSPLAMLSGRGLTVLASELQWVWLPFISLSIPLYLVRKKSSGLTNLSKKRAWAFYRR